MDFETMPRPEEKSAAELEGENLMDFIDSALRKKGADAIANKIGKGEIKIELEKNEAIEMGKIAEKAIEEKDEEFNSTDFFLKKAGEIAEELIKQYPE